MQELSPTPAPIPSPLPVPTMWIIERIQNWFDYPSTDQCIALLEDTGCLWDNLMLDEEKDAEDIEDTLAWLRYVKATEE